MPVSKTDNDSYKKPTNLANIGPFHLQNKISRLEQPSRRLSDVLEPASTTNLFAQIDELMARGARHESKKQRTLPEVEKFSGVAIRRSSHKKRPEKRKEDYLFSRLPSELLQKIFKLLDTLELLNFALSFDCEEEITALMCQGPKQGVLYNELKASFSANALLQGDRSGSTKSWLKSRILTFSMIRTAMKTALKEAEQNKSPESMLLCRTLLQRTEVPVDSWPASIDSMENWLVHLFTTLQNVRPILDEASHWVKQKKHTQAMLILVHLASCIPNVRNHDMYCSLYVQSLRGHVTDLDTRGIVGNIAIKTNFKDGNFFISPIAAERLACYVGICRSYGQMLSMVTARKNYRLFSEKTWGGDLELPESYIENQMTVAAWKIMDFLNTFAHCNSHAAKKLHIQKLLSEGSIRDQNLFIQHYQSESLHSLYIDFVSAGTESIDHPISMSPNEAMIWFHWADNELFRYCALPDLEAVMRLPGVKKLILS